jgi:VanZ family protein
LAAVAAMMLVASFNPLPLPQFWTHQDKLHHVAGFLVLGWTLRRTSPRLGLTVYLALGLSVVVGIELVQWAWLPRRTASLADVVAGMAGLAFAWWWRPGWITSKRAAH